MNNDDFSPIEHVCGSWMVEDPSAPELYRFLDGAEAALTQILEAHFTSPDLQPLVADLGEVADDLEESYDSPTAAKLVRDLISSHAVTNALRALGFYVNDTEQAVGATAQKFSEFTDDGEAKRAPHLGEKPPEGSVRPKAFRVPIRV